MSSVRSLGRFIAVLVGVICPTLCFAAGGASKPLQAPAESEHAEADSLAGQCQTLLPNGSQLLSGGLQFGRASKATVFEHLRTAVRTQTSGSLVHARAFHSATLLPNGRVLIFGGVGITDSVLTQAEIFDPDTQLSNEITMAGLTPRAHHSATLLTDGRVLIAGGIDNHGNTLSQIELWDFRSGQASTLDIKLNTPRSGQTANLLPDGAVLLWGGQDENGVPLNDGEIVDPNGPSTRLVSRRSGDLPVPSSPHLEASLPQNGETGVATNQLIALRFSKPLAMTSLNSTTISLRSSGGGNSAIKVVPAEGGILAFITAESSLDTDTTYILFISGAKDAAGQVVPDTSIAFTTAGIAVDGGSTGAGSTFTAGSNTTSATDNPQSPENHTLPADLRQLPMLKASEGVTALAGQVLTLDRSPLPNVRIEIDSRFAMTDQTGRFLVQNVGTGHHVMIVDGATANSKSVSYGLYRVGVDLKAERTNSLNYTIWMTPLDTEHEVSIPSPTKSEMVVTNPNVPGLEVHIPAGTVIRDVRGHAVTRIGITGIPVTQPPFPLKAGIQYPVYFTIQPGGATIESQDMSSSPSATNRGQGITIHYQNYLNAKPGSRFAFWSYDPEQKGWHVYGHGRVRANARDIAPEEGTQIWTLDGAMVEHAGSSDPNGAKPCRKSSPTPCNPGAGEPVDLQTGLFVYRKTDLVVNDVLPLSLSRAYRPGDSNSRAFGIGTSMPFDDFMTGDNEADAEGYTYQDLNLEDGGKVHFTRTSPCLGPHGVCDFTNALYEATSLPGEFYGATLQYVNDGGTNLGISTVDYWLLTTKDGTVYLFADSEGSTNPRAAALEGMHDRYGNALRFTRDSNFNLTQIASPNGRWIQFTYDSGNRVTQAMDNMGRTVSYAYTTDGYLETATDANNGATKYTYDNNGNMVSIQDPRGIIYVQNQYDANGMVARQTQADGSTYQFSYVLDPNGNVTQATVTDPRGYKRQVDFNADGFMTSDTRALGKPEQQTITYNRQSGTGLLLGMTDALNRTTSYSYDAMADVTSMTQLAGTSNAMTTTFAYDEHFYEPSSVMDPLGNVATMTYDSSGNLVAATDPLGNSTTLSYNTSGQPVSITDPLGNETQFGYDSGSLVSVIDPLGRTSTRAVDSAGRVVSLSDPLNDTTNLVYDSNDEITSATDPMGNQTLFAYDGSGNLQSVTDANQHTTSYTYDNMDHMIVGTDPLGHSSNTHYDSNGNVTQITDRKGQVTTVQYDGLNRPTLTQFNDGNTVTNTYDGGNRLTTIADSVSGTISRSYDGLDRLLSETTPQGSVGYTYDSDGRRRTMSVSGQSTVNYTFDNANRLTSIVQGSASVSFGYDANNRRTSLTLPNGVAATYSYDGASQLSGIVYQGGALAPANLEYTYDLAGRRTSVSGTLASTQLPAALSSAVYNANNQLTQWGSTTMTYDANGNTLSDGMNAYVWDARNRLVSANNNGAVFAYDPLGRRTGRSILSANTNYLYDGLKPVQELNGSTVTANLLTGGVDEYFTRTDTNGTTNFLTDALGSTVALTDASGNSQVQYSYGPFGAISITGTTNNSYTYTGRETDGLGLYYDRARYYNPMIARFISEDPIGLLGGINEYTYAEDSPFNFIDPTGTDKSRRGDCGSGMQHGLDELRPLMEAQEGLETRIANNVVLPGALIGSGAAVSTIGGATMVIGVITGPIGWGTLVPIGAGIFLSGVGLGAEGIEYGLHHDFIDPSNPFGPTIPGLHPGQSPEPTETGCHG